MTEQEPMGERDIRRLPEFWTPSRESETLLEDPETTFQDKEDWSYSLYNQEQKKKDVGPAGQAAFIHGEFTGKERPKFETDANGNPVIDHATKRPKLMKDPETGKPEMGPDPNFGKTYETWTFPHELKFEHAELGKLDLTKIRIGVSQEKGKAASFWGDGECIELPSNIATVSEEQLKGLEPISEQPFVNKHGKGTVKTFKLNGRTIGAEYFDDGRVNIYENRSLDTAKEQALDLKLPRMNLPPGETVRPLDTYRVKIKRVEMDVKTAPFEGNRVRGRAKFEVSVTPSPE